MKEPIGLYIHVPFCITKCNYCHFYSLEYDKITAKSYKSAVIRNVQKLAEQEHIFDTVFFGGGTPSLLYREIAEIIGLLPTAPNAEITVEANPDDIPAIAELMNGGGFGKGHASGDSPPPHRLSIGVQSLDDTLLRNLGRRHDGAGAIKAIELTHSAGFMNISADVMLGITGQTEDNLTDTLNRLTALPINHVSAYMYEPKPPYTPEQAEREEDRYARMYLKTVEFLEQKGFAQYEISNFALNGAQCRHNLKYWKCEEYIGVGPSAHSYYGGKRFAVAEDLGAFISEPIQQTYTTEENPNTFEERVMLGLRLNEGVNLDGFTECEQARLISRADAIPDELIRRGEKSLSLTAKGFLLANRIIGDLLY